MGLAFQIWALLLYQRVLQKANKKGDKYLTSY